MNKFIQHRVSAFTIFEVTVVMAIMSVIGAMVTFSVNRLMDQMAISEQLHTELNNFYKVRSTLWYDCALADSMNVDDQQLNVYKNGTSIHYKMTEESLVRIHNGNESSLNINALEIKETVQENGSEISILFDWKSDPINWKFFNRANNAESVNQYFKERNG